MTRITTRLGLVAALALGGAAIAHAQTYNSYDYNQSQQQYQQAQEQYQRDQQAYQARHDAWLANRAVYDRARADYDAEYGSGAFDAYYVDHPDAYDARFGAGAYARDFGAPAAYESGGTVVYHGYPAYPDSSYSDDDDDY